MKRIKLKDRILPEYTGGEEIFNMVTHIVGGAFGIVALVLCLVFSLYSGSKFALISSIIYGMSMIILYTMSSLYHGLKKDSTAKKVFQILDHCSIFLLIAGTYTPMTMCAIRQVDSTMAWIIFAVIWSVTIIGIVLNSIDIKRYSKVSLACYLIMGWCIVVKFNVLPEALGSTGLALLIAGGLSYSIGVIFYILQDKIKYMHSIFHLFILFGSILHFLCIIMYVL